MRQHKPKIKLQQVCGRLDSQCAPTRGVASVKSVPLQRLLHPHIQSVHARKPERCGELAAIDLAVKLPRRLANPLAFKRTCELFVADLTRGHRSHQLRAGQPLPRLPRIVLGDRCRRWRHHWMIGRKKRPILPFFGHIRPNGQFPALVCLDVRTDPRVALSC